MVEFALVAPIFFLIVFSIIEFGLLFGGQNGLVSSARELARYAAPFRVKTRVDAVNVCADVRLKAKLDNALQSSIPGYSLANGGTRRVTYSWIANPNGSYSVQLQVDLSYHFPLHVPLVGGVIDGFDNVKIGSPPHDDGKFLLAASEQMRIENEDLTSAALLLQDPSWTPSTTVSCGI